jgi:hypothetical protein
VSILRDYANDTGQWGEGGMIAEALRRMEILPTTALEFGIGDDPVLVNTWDLAERNVACVWLDSDPQAVESMALSAADAGLTSATVARHEMTNIDAFGLPDVLSIDVDGWDYRLFEAMTIRPPLVVIEHNPTVPPHINWIGQGPRQGASALALVGLASSKGYTLIGATVANLIFALEEHNACWEDLETDLEAIFDRSQLNYVISDYDGDWSATGPWAFGRGPEQPWAMEVQP